MIPTMWHGINGSRPPSLRVAKLSHTIGKTTSSDAVKHQPRQQKRRPVIIYAHSPKVIHTRAEDFMSLVQRLTGLDHKPGPQTRRNPSDVSESSSVVTEEANGDNGVGDEENTTTFSPDKKQHIADIPLFTPSSMVLFGSQNPVFRRSKPDFLVSPNRTDLVWPSVFKFNI